MQPCPAEPKPWQSTGQDIIEKINNLPDVPLVYDGHQYKPHIGVLDVIRPGHTFSENALTSTIRDNTGSSLSTDDTWIIGSTWSRGFSGVQKMFMKPKKKKSSETRNRTKIFLYEQNFPI